ncbi:uncharacterized protein LOC125039406 isoform X4 [Penaeus chinensis]|uniref:uncharacterized protein LOC125039406 isoform X4 n=1 Tax=Penaeus chinensis TaxID=139456 RepID=UPI001FB82C30|nr:uncharacterized protein LOC125039406 isoform X4 [Penaeus chinensis]
MGTKSRSKQFYDNERAWVSFYTSQVVDQDDLDDGDFDYLGGPRRPSGESPRPRSPSSPAALRATGRNSRRVSLIPGEALEQAHASLALAALTQVHEQAQQNAQLHDQSQHNKAPREKPPVIKSKTTDEGGGGGEPGGHHVGAVTTDSSPIRMKSNQRWLKLRTTVQLSGALSSSMNRAKPPLKREDSFIKRFSTRQIAELQDTVDQTDEEDVSKNSTGSPKVRKKKRQRQPRTVINPYGNVFFYWLCSLTICVLYNLWTPIVRQAFPDLQRKPQPMWYLLDGLTDIVFVVDIFVQFRTGYLEQGLIVYDFKKLARHYMQSKSFMLDIVSLVPLDFLQIVIGPQPLIRFPRFIKVYRVYNYYYMVESRTLYPNMWRVVNLIHILLLLAHWFGCFYYMLSEAEQFVGEWTYPYDSSPDFQTLSRMYLGSVYWSTLTLTTIGDLPTPETNRQYIFTIVSYLIGVFIFATIVGQVGNVITNRNANRLEFERLLDGAKLYMRHHKVPRAMQRRVQRWYDYSWSRGRIQGGGDINTALGLLPDKLKTELALHVNLLTLKKVSIFKECQPEFLHDLVLKMKAYIFTPGDLICRKGEVAREMFIIADGILEVISETGKVLTTMKAGDFFGEIGILNLDGLNKRTADVRSVGYSELFSLSREDVLMAMKDYPEAQEILQSLGRKRLMEARHQASKSGSSGSSKRGTPSPNKESGLEDKNAKKIVSRLRSDVTAIRNAFRRSKGTTRYTETLEQDHITERSTDNETLELEPLTAEHRASLEDEAPVKRILKRISGRSGSDSSTGTRGVLKRMARVTSDEVTQAVSPGRAPSNEEPQGVLGAGLPLLQRLKLLKEKEEREEKERQKAKEEEESKKEEKPPEPEKEPEKEPQVIGAGLPLFARLRLLQAKEEKERIEQEEREKAEQEKKGSQPPQEGAKEEHPAKPQPEGQVSVDKEGAKPSEAKAEVSEAKPRPGGLLKGRLRAAVLTKAPPPTLPIMEVTPAGEAAPPPASADKDKASSPTAEQKEKADAAAKPTAINDLNKGVEKKSPEGENGDRLGSEKPREPKDIHANSNSVQGGQALERAFGKLLSKKLNTAPKERTSPTVIENPVDDGLKVQNTTSKEKISRSDSFKRAMDEGLIRSTEEPDLNIKPCEEAREAEATPPESEADAPTPEAADKKAGESQSENEASPQSEAKEIAEEQALEAEKKLEVEGKERLERLIRRCGSERRRSSSPKLARTPTSRQHHRVDSLKVPSDDVSPPLSSPESTETPERKSLKSILKRMSREDSRGNLLPPDGADLRKLMKAPTVEGFVARRSKLSKSVSFQRKTLASPPPPALLNELKSSQVDGSGNGAPLITSVLPLVPSKESAKESRSATTDGVNKLMAKLGSMGLDGSPDTQTQDLVLGVRKILRDKMDDVEVAWVQRVEELQQQVAARDATIRHLTHTISRLQASVGVEPRIAEGSLPAGELVPCPSIIRSSSSDASSDGSDDDEPLFMRCNSIESIIHQSPEESPEGGHVPLGPRQSWPRQGSVEQVGHRAHFTKSLDDPRTHGQIVLDIGSSTDEELYSFDSDEDHVIYGDLMGDLEDSFENDLSGAEEEDIFPVLDEEEEDEDEDECDAEQGDSGEAELSSQDWEVQLLAKQLAEEQRGVARLIDRDIAEGRLDSALAELHEALASDNLGPLSDIDLARLEKAVRREREKLRRYARMYSLDERPVLEDQFTSLYRSRSQLLLNRSSELCRAGPTERRLSLLLDQLTKMPPAEQFLLDRLVYTTARRRKLSRQRSLCDEQLASYDTACTPISNKSKFSMSARRSMSVCSPPPGSAPTPFRETPPPSAPTSARGSTSEGGPPTVSAMLASLQRSVVAISTRGRGSTSSQGSHKEGAPLLRPPR